MSAKSNIEWTDATWNPIRARNLQTGKIGWHCEHATTGCEFCYSESFNLRLGTGLPFKPGHRNDVEIFLDKEMLLAPLHWKRPRKIFVCSMTDLFAEFVKDEWIDQMFAVMALCPQHTFQILTKRADWMISFFDDETSPRESRINCQIWSTLGTPIGSKIKHGGNWQVRALPLPNVWFGISCERQDEADERVPLLARTPAAVRFVSVEPLLGPIRMAHLFSKIDWVIVGGESGPKARPMHPQWARDIHRQCDSAGVAFFFKQWGTWAPPDAVPPESWSCSLVYIPSDVGLPDCMMRVGKKAAGRALDDKIWSEFPSASGAST